MPKGDKGGYLLPWTNVYQKYITFSNARDQNHPCHKLTQSINSEEGNLERDLGYLEKYYAEIRHFLNLADTAKTSPNSVIDGSTTVQQALKAKEAELCNYGDTLLPYYYGYTGGLRALASIAGDIDAWIALVKQQTGLAGAPLGKEVVTALLNEVKSISNKVREDWEAEVGSDFNTYVKGRRMKLLELEGMPPLPPTPKPGT